MTPAVLAVASAGFSLLRESARLRKRVFLCLQNGSTEELQAEQQVGILTHGMDWAGKDNEGKA